MLLPKHWCQMTTHHSQWVWSKNSQFEDCYPGFWLAFHMLSSVTLINYLNLSILIWSMGTMMIILLLIACVPAKNRWPLWGLSGSWVWNKYELFYAGFFFFLRKVFEVRETGNPEVPLYFGEGLRRSLGNAAGCGGGGQMGCAGLSFAFMFLCVETQLGAISWCVRISQTNLELSNAFVPEEMFVLSDVNILCISAGLWLQVGSPNRLRSDLNKTVCFPRTLFS